MSVCYKCIIVSKQVLVHRCTAYRSEECSSPASINFGILYPKKVTEKRWRKKKQRE